MDPTFGRGRCTKVFGNLHGASVDGCNKFVSHGSFDMCEAYGCHFSFHLQKLSIRKRDSIENVIDICDELEPKMKRVCKMEVITSPFLCESIAFDEVLTTGACLKAIKIEAPNSPCMVITFRTCSTT